MAKDNPFNNYLFDNKPGRDPYAGNGTALPSAPPQGAASAWVNSGAPPPASIPLAGAPAGAWGASSSRVYEEPAPSFTSDDQDYTKRAAALDRREAELRGKEAEIKKVEDELRRTGALRPEKNWPPCYPILHHDIAGEIPADQQGMVRSAYWAFLGFVIAITFNLIGSLVALCAMNGNDGRLTGFFLSAVYWFAGVPGAWILWYARLYNAAIKDRAFTYAWFFLMFAAHIIFCIWSAASPPLPLGNSWSHTGFILGVQTIGSNALTGIFYLVGGAVWTLESLWSFWTLKAVYGAFRGGGGDRRLKQEVASAVAGHAAAGAASRV
ncbi:hypothetical protein WJX81_000509 [Elliptochloris bilobata]|uniref:Secretory carrier-associated membrane protein n=1 Tax=Elliptochloris bilobata TaxID=381761 RepID=A0AAW1SIX0_9CHLO